MMKKMAVTNFKYDDAYWEEEYQQAKIVLKGRKEWADANTILYWGISIIIVYLLFSTK